MILLFFISGYFGCQHCHEYPVGKRLLAGAIAIKPPFDTKRHVRRRKAVIFRFSSYGRFFSEMAAVDPIHCKPGCRKVARNSVFAFLFPHGNGFLFSFWNINSQPSLRFLAT